jgi:hypothetical protein
MGFFTQANKTVDLGDGNTATLRKPTFGDSQAAASPAARVKGDGNILMDWPRYRMELLKLCLVSWDGPGFEGRPPTGENIEALPSGVGALLADEVQELSRLDKDAGN